MQRIVLTLFTVLMAAPLRADVLVLNSGPQQVGLLELYTSEGCSSCPPADRWLHTLAGRPGLFSEFIPLAFHVDYWDYIGWKDRFARAEFSERQRRYARLGEVSTVYTPGFVYNGREWRNFFGGDAGRFPAGGQTGELTLRVDESTIEISFDAGRGIQGPFVANLALLGFGLRSKVDAGENRGRELRHDFLVLAHDEAKLAAQGGEQVGRMAMPASTVAAERYALVAWVSAAQNPAPLQAVGDYLPADR